MSSFQARFREMQRLRALCQDSDAHGSASSDPSARDGVLSCFSDITTSPMVVKDSRDGDEIAFSTLCNSMSYSLHIPVRKCPGTAPTADADRKYCNAVSHYHKAVAENAALMLACGSDYKTEAGICCLLRITPTS